jgi:glutamate-1-semialdehyde 2,1-aminomutase
MNTSFCISRVTDMNFVKAKALLERNARLIPGGLGSLNRLCDPCIAFARARGSRMWDVDSNEYIDYHAGFAPYILGHNDPDLTEAVVQSLFAEKSNYGSGPTEEEGQLAALFLQCLPFAERVQFFNTGSEATAQAIRVARAWTGKPHVILMQGGYNGHHNVVAANLMSTKAQLGGRRIAGDEYPLVPITAGIPEAERQLMHAIEFNDLDAVETVARKYEIAALITEPVLQNVGVIKPKPGYLAGLRTLADRYGFLLIFDEVKTGFRASLGGYQSVAGVVPDLSTFGKAFANGFPISALAGRKPFMDLAISSDPAKRVLAGGTYNCHPVPVAAAIACLKKLMNPDLDVYGTLERLAQRLEKGQRELFEKHSVRAVISRVGSAHCVYFAAQEPACWWDVLELHDVKFDSEYRRALLERGVYYFPVPCKQGSISFAHTEQDIDCTLGATDDALAVLARKKQ